MTTINESTGSGTEALARAVEKDIVLVQLASMANDSPSAEVGITLSVGGALVSGNLIGGPTYFKRQADAIRGVANGESLAEYFETFGSAQYAGSENKDRLTLADLYNSITFIHLSDVTVMLTNVPTVRLSLWRGRLAAVDGWSLGRLGVTN
jgi:hypothetical protein